MDPVRPPDPVHPVHPVDPIRPFVPPYVPCPWTEAELARIVEDACAFIADARARHGNRLGRLAGDYLLDNVYRGDERLVRLNDPTKTSSLWDLASAVGVPEPTLRSWIVYAIVRRKLLSAGLDPDLSMKHLLALDRLGDDLEAMASLVAWAEESGASAEELADVVRRLVEGNGTIDDVHPHEPRKKKKKKNRGGLPRPLPDDLVVPRLLGIVDRALGKRPPSSSARAAIRKAVIGILSMLGEKP